jgi:hypothetical protein
MQSTGHTSTQASSFVPMHGSQITYVKLDAPCLSVVPVGVDFREVPPLFGQVIFGEDRLHGTGWLARATVDAFVRVNVEQFRPFKLRFVLSRVNAIDRANVHTSRVLRPYAGFRNNISHLSLSLLFESSSQEMMQPVSVINLADLIHRVKHYTHSVWRLFVIEIPCGSQAPSDSSGAGSSRLKIVSDAAHHNQSDNIPASAAPSLHRFPARR